MTYEHDNLRAHSEEVCQSTVHNPSTTQSECEAEAGKAETELEKLQQEIKILIARIPQIFEEIASIAVAAQVSMEISDEYEYFVESIRYQLELLKSIENEIHEYRAKIKQASILPCCERSLNEAHIYCGECGKKMELAGKICENCNAYNPEKNEYCCMCGAKFAVKEPAQDPNICQNCNEAYPAEIDVKFCPNCGARRVVSCEKS